MTDSLDADAAFFHESSETVRFWVVVGEQVVGASVGRGPLHHRFRPTSQGDDPLETFHAHLADIEAAVRQRIAEGASAPVMLREYDLRPRGPQGAG